MDPTLLLEPLQSPATGGTYGLLLMIWLGVTAVLSVLALIRVRAPAAAWLLSPALLVTAGQVWTVMATDPAAQPATPARIHDALGLGLGASTLVATAWMAALVYRLRAGEEPRRTWLRALASAGVAAGLGGVVTAGALAQGGLWSAGIGATAVASGLALAFMGTGIGSERRDRKRMHRARRMVTLCALFAVACATGLAWDGVLMSGLDATAETAALKTTLITGGASAGIVLGAAAPVVIGRLLGLIGIRPLIAGALVAVVLAIPAVTRVWMWFATWV